TTTGTATASRISSSSSTQTITTTSTPTTFQQQALLQHNYYRQLHCTDALVFNSTINAIAQTYANYLAANNLFQHSGTSGLGENLWTIWSSGAIRSVNGSSPTNSWYNEINSYNFGSPGFSSSTGHFTQVIWKGSKQLGIGIAFTSDNRTAYVVANYYPPGNVIGSFSSNVLPLCSTTTPVSATTTSISVTKNTTATTTIPKTTSSSSSTTASRISTTTGTATASRISSSSSTQTITTTSTPTTFQQQALLQHNYYRQLHCTDALVLNSTINAIAQTYANYLAANNLFQHSGTSGLGENLWTVWSSGAIRSVNGSSPTNSWYSEISSYNFGSPGFSSSTGHFTQVIWKGSKQLGIGIALTSNKRTAYVVANYYPSGNVIGSFSSNVLPLCSTMTKALGTTTGNSLTTSTSRPTTVSRRTTVTGRT
ncbi:unnamed protein product, partial [Rotaria sp. Silwood1]